MEGSMRSRRALLYVPGNDIHKIDKAAGLPVDGVILDLEDGVAANRKDEARMVIPDALEKMDFGRSERLVRINPFSSGRAEMDLKAILPAHPEAILVPKVDGAQVLIVVDQMISAIESSRGWLEGSITIIALIESARAFLNLPVICAASPRLQALVFGGEDLSADAGMTRTPAGLEMLYARSALVMHAAAFGLQAIDMVQPDFSDLQLLTTEANQGAELGFSGKQIIHPAQIEVVQRAFTPSERSIQQAMRIVEEARVALAEGRGAFTIDGKMVDMPVIKRAETVLSRARAAGLID
jgi:citrate lyase subunit beta-like protein